MLQVWESLGILAFCISGALAARQQGMDWFGMYVVAVVTGTGGGVLRSLLIGDLPPRLLTRPDDWLLALAATIAAVAGASVWHRIRRMVSVLDAIGLGLFTSTGIRIAQAHGLPWWSCLALGVISATFGGLLRDVIRNEVPLILKKEIYATACMAGGVVLLGLDWLQVEETIVLSATTLVVVLIRLWAIRYAIHQSEVG